jgi:hypothetical protein
MVVAGRNDVCIEVRILGTCCSHAFAPFALEERTITRSQPDSYSTPVDQAAALCDFSEHQHKYCIAVDLHLS